MIEFEQIDVTVFKAITAYTANSQSGALKVGMKATFIEDVSVDKLSAFVDGSIAHKRPGE